MGKASRKKRDGRSTQAAIPHTQPSNITAIPNTQSKTTAEVLARTRDTLLTAELAMNAMNQQGDPRYHTSALRNIVVFGRAVTNVLQNLRNIEPGFDEWYVPYVAKMRSDPQTRFLYELRTRILKLGEMPTGSSVTITGDPLALMRHFPQPPNAKGFFVGDRFGGSGWVVALANGQEETYYVDLPASLPGLTLDVNLHFADAPPEFQLVPVQEICGRYLAFLRVMVDDASKRFLGV